MINFENRQICLTVYFCAKRNILNIDDVTSTHFNAHYIKSKIITNTFILQ